MTDYTPEEKAHDLVCATESYIRLKEERDELLEALKLSVRIIPRAWMPAAKVTYAEWDSAFEKIEAIIAKVEK